LFRRTKFEEAARDWCAAEVGPVVELGKRIGRKTIAAQLRELASACDAMIDTIRQRSRSVILRQMAPFEIVSPENL